MQSEAKSIVGNPALGKESISKCFLTRCARNGKRQQARLVPLVFIFGLLLPTVCMDGEADCARLDHKVHKVHKIHHKSRKAHQVHKIIVTAYTNVPQCTDDTPDETASLLLIRPKHYWNVIALSRDIAKDYKFGDKFRLLINGKPHMVVYEDRMPAKHTKKIDLLLPSIRECREFGKQKGILIPITKHAKKARQSARHG
jgi:3D (Asp-Asp-Asp) domain-containing protein